MYNQPLSVCDKTFVYKINAYFFLTGGCYKWTEK